jgi:hypothetical protein
MSATEPLTTDIIFLDTPDTVQQLRHAAAFSATASIKGEDTTKAIVDG